MKVYIAGKMRGLPNWGFDEFHRLEQKWKDAGHHPISPAATTLASNYSPDSNLPFRKEDLKYAISVDIAALFLVDAIALIPGWEDSAGVAVELALAQFLGLEVYCAETMKPLDIAPKPWLFNT